MSAPKGESSDARSQRLAREHEAKLRVEHYGLPLDQLHAAHALPGDTLDLRHTAAERDGIRVGKPGAEIAKLIAHGFLEMTAANGHDAIAKVTRAGLAALVLRLKR